MSSQSAMPLSPSVMTARSPSRMGSKLSISGLSISGVVLFAMSFLVVASGFTSLRPDVMGLALHPYLIPVAVAFPLVLVTRVHEFPIRVMCALLVFTGMYCFSVFSGGSIAVGEIFKTASAVITIVTCALLVRRRGDFVAGALALSIAIALLAWHGLQDETKLGVEAMQGANKNSYSLFALPAILMAGYIALRLKTVPVVVKGILVASTLPTLLAIFMSGNRSGYLGAVVVGLMLFKDRRGRGLILVAAITGAVAFLILQFGNTAVLDQRIKQTMEGNKSDEHRRDILFACLDIGLENPLIGVSPQVLPFEIGRRTSVKHSLGLIEAHNIFAHVFAGSGVICFFALIAVGWAMWSWKPRGGGKVGGNEDPLRDALRMLRMMVILWVVRGMFTREILFNPSFNIGLGLSIGLCMLAETVRPRGGVTSSKPSPSALPPPVTPALPRPAAG
ncbi:MAG: O-antigen ligase family protein [Planctomycetia bacterium]|nr:O-antigen ligase family protein [Planctomycetia bacterium]